MVIKGDFKIELVEAESKTPYKEHTKDEEVYVEVEPNAEYYLSVQRINTSLEGDLVAKVSVDGKSLGWRCGFIGRKEPYFIGLLEEENGMDSECSLQFVIPDKLNDIHEETQQELRPQTLMGKVEVQLYEAILKDKDESQSESTGEEKTTDEFSPDKISEEGTSLLGAKYKCVRSAKGNKKVFRQHSPSRYKSGKTLVHEISLNYCTVHGLVLTDILPRPLDIYKNHVLMTGQKRPALDPIAVQPLRLSKKATIPSNGKDSTTEVIHHEFFDLTGLSSDDDEDHNDE